MSYFTPKLKKVAKEEEEPKKMYLTDDEFQFKNIFQFGRAEVNQKHEQMQKKLKRLEKKILNHDSNLEQLKAQRDETEKLLANLYELKRIGL